MDAYTYMLDPHPDRPRGVLTKKERQHLLGQLDESPEEDAGAIRQRERRIGEHLRNSILDLALIAQELPPELLEKAFGPDADDPAPTWPLAALLYVAQSERMATSLEELLVEGSLDTGQDPRAVGMEDQIREAIPRVLAAREGVAVESVDVSIDVQRADNEAAELSTDELAQLDPRVLDQLYASARITSEQYSDAVRARIGRDTGMSPPSDDVDDEE